MNRALGVCSLVGGGWAEAVRRGAALVLGVLLVVPPPGFAGTPVVKVEPGSTSGATPAPGATSPSRPVPQSPAPPMELPPGATVQAPNPEDNPPGTPSKEEVKKAAARLGLQGEVLQLGVEGLGHIYARRYKDARGLFDKVTRDYPASAVGPFGHVLLYQAWMLENYDFSKEADYKKASAEGIFRAEAAIEREEAMAWNHFVRGALLGLDSIYLLRRAEYLTALNAAAKAINSIETALKLDPAFHDAALCIGVYNYWRSVLTDQYWFLPSFGDQRQTGIAQIQKARTHGIFTGPGARLALAYTYLQENRVDLAKEQCRELAALYPDNLINNMLLGRIAMRERKLRMAKWYFAKVKEVSPENWLVEYYLGTLAMRERRFVDARDHLQKFLAHDGDVAAKAWAHFRLGDTYWQLELDDAARREWQAALDLNDDLEGAKKRLAGQVPRRVTAAPSAKTPGTKTPTTKVPGQPKRPPPADADLERTGGVEL